MSNDIEREAFESQFAPPHGVYWSPALEQYEAQGMEFEPDADEYHRMWRVWKSAKADSAQGAKPVGEAVDMPGTNCTVAVFNEADVPVGAHLYKSHVKEQCAEPVAVVELSNYIHLSGAKASQRKALKETSEGSIQNLPEGTELYTQPQIAEHKKVEISPTARQIIAEFVGDSVAHDLIFKLEDHLGIYEDVYEQIVEIIEPHVCREGANPDGLLPASVVGSVSVLLEKALSEQPQSENATKHCACQFDQSGKILNECIFHQSRRKPQISKALSTTTQPAQQGGVPFRLVEIAEEEITDAAAEAQEGGSYDPAEWAKLVLSMLPTSTTSPDTNPEACYWHGDDNGCWKGSCGIEWYFEDGGPDENGVNHCPRCGRARVNEEQEGER